MPEHDMHDEDVHLPEPTVWPFVMAAAITLIAAGFVLGAFVLVGGAVLFIISAWGWVHDLLGPDMIVEIDDDDNPEHGTERGDDV